MLEARFSCVTIVACLAGNSPLQRRFGRHRRTTRRVAARLQTVIRQMEPALLASPALVRYPWCFLMPDGNGDSRHYFIGAFLPPLIADAYPPEMLYARVSERWLLAHLQSTVGLPLWLSRTLVPLIHGTSQSLLGEEVRQACDFLQRLLAPTNRPWLRRPPQAPCRQLDNLCTVRCEADEELWGEHGVDAMPWMDWPGCIQHNESIWLWRQSRHGKVIESQKVMIEQTLD